MKNIITYSLAAIVATQLVILQNNKGVIERQREQLTQLDTLSDQVMIITSDRDMLKAQLEAIGEWEVVYAPAASEPEPVVSSSNLDLAAAAILKKDGPEAARDFRDAIEVNIRPALQEKLSPIVAAIRHAENGAAGKEYGVLGEGVKRDMERRGATYRPQAGWCAATVQKTYDRWVEAGEPGIFVRYLGNRYCPVGAENDPTGLNVNWQRNVKRWYGIILDR